LCFLKCDQPKIEFFSAVENGLQGERAQDSVTVNKKGQPTGHPFIQIIVERLICSPYSSTLELRRESAAQ
jgi:hypothetical protein